MGASFLALALVLPVSAGVAADEPPRLVRDLHRRVSSDPEQVVVAGRTAYFKVSAPEGCGVWATDGTPDGTRPLMGLGDDALECILGTELASAGGRFYFTSNGRLWTSDGTPDGTRRLSEPVGQVFDRVDLGGRLLFAAGWNELWTSAGTRASTRLVKRMPGSGPKALTVVGDRAYFVMDHEYCDTEVCGPDPSLWRTDGTTAGTVRVRVFRSGWPEELARAGDRLVFTILTRDGVQLWRSDGTATGTRSIAPLGSGSLSEVGRLTSAGPRVFLVGRDTDHGIEPWVTDGTSAGTRLLRDIAPGRRGSDPRNFLRVGPLMFFTADDPVHGTRLWRSDGTTAGTRPVSDVHPYERPSIWGPHMAALKGELWFAAQDAEHGVELWRSDGTAAGTRLTVDLAGARDGSPSELTPFRGRLLFSATDHRTGVEPWITDGTSEGTRLLADIVPAGGSDPDGFVSAGGRTWSTARTAKPWTGSKELLLLVRSDGTPGGTKVIERPRDPIGLGVAGRYVVFSGVDDAGRELWRSDGTFAGTRRIADIERGSRSGIEADPAVRFVTMGGVAYFRAWDRTHGAELWRTDGTADGTWMVRDVEPGAGELYPQGLTASHGRLWFTGMVQYDGGASTEALWVSDGTGAGTQRVYHWAPDGASLETRMPGQLLAVGSRVFLAAGDATNGRELWVSDGTQAGTRLVADIRGGADGSAPRDLLPFAGGVLFTATSEEGRAVWRSDGTADGTRRVTSGTCEAGNPLGPRDLRRVGSRVFFVAASGTWTDEGCVGTETFDLWVTDGTADGTRRLRPDGVATGIDPRHLVAADGRVWFSADDGVHGRELWVSDGTPDGTTMVADLRADGGSNPLGLTRAGDALWFSADDGRHGREPWIVRP